MNTVNQFYFDTHKSLEAYSDYNSEKYINADKFGAIEKFNGIWDNCHSELVNKYSLPAFHLYKDGFHKGDADDNDIKDIVKRININEGSKTVTAEGIFVFLDRKFLEIIEPKVNTLIKEYNDFCENKLTDN